MQIDWLQSPAGLSLLSQEQAAVRAALERVFGDQLLQVGSWGPPEHFLSFARTQANALLSDDQSPGAGAQVAPDRLPVLSDSVDAVLLPHTLEVTPEPHAVLREVYRVLRPDGRLIVLGFNPASMWGLRHTFSPNGFPPGIRRQIRRKRMRDWLRLLNLTIESSRGVYASTSATRAGKLLRRWHWFASAYLTIASKTTVPVTIIRPRVPAAAPARLVSGLVNPTTRNAG